MYQPTLGRFLSRDPLPQDEAQILYPFPTMNALSNAPAVNEFDFDYENAYGYVRNNPVNAVDPAGAFPCNAAQTRRCNAQCRAYCAKQDVPVDKAICDAWKRTITISGVVCEVLGHNCDCTCQNKKKRWKWRCTVKPRGTCAPHCQIIKGGGDTEAEAKRDATQACFATGCNTPGPPTPAKPYNCQCSHPSCFRLPN
jgi:RHS repeat-associated protein